MQLLEENTDVLSFIDWLGLSVRMQSDPCPIPHHTWQEYPQTNVWGKRRMLYNENGDKVLTLLYEPRTTVVSSNAGLLEIENEWLYHGGGPEYILELLQQSLFYEVIGISRLDLCADFNPTKSQADIIEGLANGDYYVAGKRNGSGFWSTNLNPPDRLRDGTRRPFLNEYWCGRKIPHCQSWGHKTSELKWKLYYKTKELLDDGGGKVMMKPYIIDQWRMAGFDTSNVWRLECSMKHLNNTRMWGERISLDFVREYRGLFFSQQVNQHFIIRKNQGHKDKTNDEVVRFLPVENVGARIQRKEYESLAERSGRITLLRRLITSLDDEQVYLDRISREDCLEHIGKVIKRDGLQNYFRAMTGMWFEEYGEFLERKAAGRGPIEITQRSKTPPVRPNYDFDEGELPEHLKTASEALKKQRMEFQETLDNLSKSIRKPPDPQTKLDL